MTLSIPGVDLLPCTVVIECYAGPPCTALVSDRVRVLALKQPECLSLPGRAERVTNCMGHKGPTGAQLKMASSLSGSGIGIWGEMDKLVAADPSLSVLRDGSVLLYTMCIVLSVMIFCLMIIISPHSSAALSLHQRSRSCIFLYFSTTQFRFLYYFNT